LLKNIYYTTAFFKEKKFIVYNFLWFTFSGVCSVFLILFIAVNFFNRNEGGFSAADDNIDPNLLAEQGGGMFGPHGVPGGAAPSKLEAETQEQYNVAGGGANNPFLQEQTDPNYTYSADGSRIEGNQGQYYGAGYSQAQSGYSSSGYGNFALFFKICYRVLL